MAPADAPVEEDDPMPSKPHSPVTLVAPVAVAAALLLAAAPLSAQSRGPGGRPGAGLLTTTGCVLDSCAERGPVTDPDGLTATGCVLGSCGEKGASSDPDGLTARPRPSSPAPSFLAWLRSLFGI